MSGAQLIIGLSKRGYKAGKVGFRAMLVLILWIVVVPLISTWIWRLSLSRSMTQWLELICTRLRASAYVATDCIYGSLLTAAIILALFAGSSLRAYIRFLREMRTVENLHNNNNPALRRGAGEEEGDDDDDDGDGQGNVDGIQNEVNRLADLINPAEDWTQDQIAGERGLVDNQAAAAAAGFGGGHPRQDFLQDGMEGAPDPDDIPIAEMIGLHGNVVIVLESALTILCTNAAFLFCTAFIPFCIGRSVLAGVDFFLKHGPQEYRPPQAVINWIIKALAKQQSHTPTSSSSSSSSPSSPLSPSLSSSSSPSSSSLPFMQLRPFSVLETDESLWFRGKGDNNISMALSPCYYLNT